MSLEYVPSSGQDASVGAGVCKCLSWFRVRGSGFGVQGSGFRVQGAGFRVQSSRFRVQGAEFRVQGAGFRVQGAGTLAMVWYVTIALTHLQSPTASPEAFEAASTYSRQKNAPLRVSLQVRKRNAPCQLHLISKCQLMTKWQHNHRDST